jgi:hypothetical protein
MFHGQGVGQFAGIENDRFAGLAELFVYLLLDFVILGSDGDEGKSRPVGQLKITPVTLIKAAIGGQLQPVKMGADNMIVVLNDPRLARLLAIVQSIRKIVHSLKSSNCPQFRLEMFPIWPQYIYLIHLEA